MKNNLPASWTTAELCDVITSVSTNEKKLKQKEYQETGIYPVVDQGHIFIGGYTNDEKLVIDCELPIIIFGDHTKVLKFINFKFVVGADGVKILKPKKCFDPKLFFYFLHCLKFIDKGYARHYQYLIKENINVPPLPEQHRIVAKLEELFSELDSAVEALKKAKEQIKTYKQSVLSSAFSGKLTINNSQLTTTKQLIINNSQLTINKETGLPVGWKWVKVKEVGDITTGTTPSKANNEYYDNSYPFYKPTDLDYGYNTRFANDNLSELGIKQARLLPEKSILITCIGATIGKTGLIRKAGASNQQINSIIPNKSFIPEFVYYYSVSPKFQTSIKENASATTLPILNKSKFEVLNFIYAPIEIQQQIVSEIETRFSEAENLEKTIDVSLTQAESLRQSILKKAFEGRLVPQDANDEPAAVLLDRIKAERKLTINNSQLIIKKITIKNDKSGG